MKWRFIPFKRYDPYFKTGMNTALINSVAEGGRPIAFLAGWESKCVNIGRSQNLKDRVNVEKARKDGVKIVRRQGGGGATFLTPEGELTWGLIDRNENFPEDVNKVYSQVCGRIAKKLSDIGIEAEHEPINDIVTPKGKISGSTLKREEGVTYIGGTLLLEVDAEEMFNYLNPDPEKNERHGIDEFKQRVTSVTSESDADREEIKKCLKDALLKDGDYEISSIKSGERKTSKELAEKFSDEDWINGTDVQSNY